MKFKIPKIKLPVLITTRQESGKKEFIGLTGIEWVQSTGALCALYAVLAGFFAVLLVIAQAIRNKSDFVRLYLSFRPLICCPPLFVANPFALFFFRALSSLQYVVPGTEQLDEDDDEGEDEE